MSKAQHVPASARDQAQVSDRVLLHELTVYEVAFERDADRGCLDIARARRLADALHADAVRVEMAAPRHDWRAAGTISSSGRDQWKRV
jgi:hypothetical protein